MRLFATFALSVLLACSPLAQTVGSITVTSPQSMDGLYVDAEGHLYATTGWLGATINRIEMDGTSSLFAGGIVGPIHLTATPDGRYFTTDFREATVSEIAPDGTVSTFATTREGPSDLAVGPDGALYVTHYGDPFGFGDGDSVSRIAPDGTTTIYAEGGTLRAPVGLAFDDAGHLFVANIGDGRITRIAPDGTMSLFATVPPLGAPTGLTLGHLVWGNGELYATYLDGHQVLAFDAQGTQRVVAGTGTAGRDDGPVAEATFDRPNGIALSVTGDTLFVSEYVGPNTRVRTISPVVAATANEDIGATGFGLDVAPNPTQGETHIRFRLHTTADVALTVHDLIGREVDRRLLGARPPGEHTVAWAPAGLPPGGYIVRLTAGSDHATRMLTLQR